VETDRGPPEPICTSLPLVDCKTIHFKHSHVMFSLHAARHCHSFTLLRRSLISSRTPAIRHASLKTLARPQSIVRHCQPAIQRHASSQNLIRAGAASSLNRSMLETHSGAYRTSAYSIPVISSLDLLNVYQGSVVRTVSVGMMRIVTIVVFGLGVTMIAPRMFFDPDQSMWWVPGILVGSAVPLVLTALLSAPYVSTIRVLVPPSAKKSTEALMRFAERVPADTKVSLQSMRWLPWPTHKEVFFSDLRRLPGRKLSVNLEHIPLGNESAENASKIVGGRLAMRMYGRYWVDMTSRNKSQAPGVWEKMWEQIPIKGQEPLKTADRKPPVMANRTAPPRPSSGAARVSPPPPPVMKGRSRGGKSRR